MPGDAVGHAGRDDAGSQAGEQLVDQETVQCPCAPGHIVVGAEAHAHPFVDFDVVKSHGTAGTQGLGSGVQGFGEVGGGGNAQARGVVGARDRNPYRFGGIAALAVGGPNLETLRDRLAACQ